MLPLCRRRGESMDSITQAALGAPWAGGAGAPVRARRGGRRRAARHSAGHGRADRLWRCGGQLFPAPWFQPFAVGAGAPGGGAGGATQSLAAQRIVPPLADLHRRHPDHAPVAGRLHHLRHPTALAAGAAGGLAQHFYHRPALYAAVAGGGGDRADPTAGDPRADGGVGAVESLPGLESGRAAVGGSPGAAGAGRYRLSDGATDGAADAVLHPAVARHGAAPGRAPGNRHRAARRRHPAAYRGVPRDANLVARPSSSTMDGGWNGSPGAFWTIDWRTGVWWPPTSALACLAPTPSSS